MGALKSFALFLSAAQKLLATVERERPRRRPAATTARVLFRLHTPSHRNQRRLRRARPGQPASSGQASNGRSAPDRLGGSTGPDVGQDLLLQLQHPRDFVGPVSFTRANFGGADDFCEVFTLSAQADSGRRRKARTGQRPCCCCVVSCAGSEQWADVLLQRIDRRDVLGTALKAGTRALNAQNESCACTLR